MHQEAMLPTDTVNVCLCSVFKTNKMWIKKKKKALETTFPGESFVQMAYKVCYNGTSYAI